MGCYEVLESLKPFFDVNFTTLDVVNITGLSFDTVSKNLSRLVKVGVLDREDVYSQGKKSFYYLTVVGKELFNKFYGDNE